MINGPISLQELFLRDDKVYMAHVYYGDPDEEFSRRLIKLLCKSGVDILEFGIPFSDPVADGPVFQRSCERALNAGMTPERAIEGIRKLKEEGILQPIVVTSYFNIILRMGVDNFVKRIKGAGAAALIVPNVPYEEADPLINAGNEHGVDIIFLVAPTTPEERLRDILTRARGFVYVVAVTGVTGARDSIEKATIRLVKKVQAFSDIPILVGFGISRPEHARAIMDAGADGVITGSAIGRIYEGDIQDPDRSLSKIETFARGIKEQCRSG